MKLLARFKGLVEDPPDLPDDAWLAFAVCAMSPDGCGWSGWILDGVFKRTAERHPTATGGKLLPQGDDRLCPAWGGTLFRTGHDRRMETCADQEPHWKEGIDYEPADGIEYE